MTFLTSLIFDSKLTWQPQISSLAGRLCRVIAVIYKLKKMLGYKWLISLYNGHFLPLLIYCCPVWGHVVNAHMKQHETLQKRILKIIHHVELRTRSKVLFERLKCLPIKELYYYQVLIFVLKFIHNLLPSTFTGFYI